MKKSCLFWVFILILSKGAPAQNWIYGDNYPLVNIQDVSLEDDMVFALTSQEPSIHIFSGKKYKSWGAEGKGPGELSRPVAIEVDNSSVFVLDAPPGACKVVKYTFKGEYVTSEAVRGVQMCYDLKVSGKYKVLQTGKWMHRKNELVLLGKNSSTLISYKEPEPVRIEPAKGPVGIYNFVSPFVAQPHWSANSKGKLIFWGGNSNSISIIDLKTGEKELLKIPSYNLAIQPADIKAWISEEFSPNQERLGIPDPFRNVRGKIREEVSFPGSYPLLSDIKTDPHGGIWVLRASKQSGEIWSYLTLDGNHTTVKFPESREVVAFGKEFVAMTTKDKNGIEYVELYRREQFLTEKISISD